MTLIKYEVGSTLCVREETSTGKVTKCYRFSSEERRDAYIARYEAAAKDRADRAAAAKEAKKALRETLVNPFKVGDVFTESWGYDQTNVDAYVVTAVTAKSIVLRACGLVSDHATGPMSDSVKPDPTFITGTKDIRKTLQPVAACTYYPHGVYVPSVSGHGSMSLWDGSKTTHRSWYA